jgi:AraC-like DNA-binding protein
MENFGLRVGLDTDVSEIGAFGRAVGAATTLQCALRVFLGELDLHSSSSEFGLRREEEHAWFWRAGLPGLRCDPIEQYALGLMIQIVRLAAGPRWVPDRIALQAAELPGEGAAESLAASRIQGRAARTAIRLPAELLARPLRGEAVDVNGELSRLRSDAAEDDLAGSLRQAILPLLPDGSPGLVWAADAVNSSPRTLKRRLRELGLTWSGLVEQARFDRARELLETSDLRLGDVARRVGYADPANFSRAFRRWTGVAPSAYR